jgi:hypothetical protein
MKKYIRETLILIGVILMLAGQWISFDIYANTKIKNIGANISTFIYGLHSGETLIKLPHAEENLIVFKDLSGKTITTDNALRPINPQKYLSSYSKSPEGKEVHIYTKRQSFSQYLDLLISNPFAIGIFLSGLILVLMGIFIPYKETVKGEEISRKEELIRKLKALRLTLAVGGIIPNRSVQEAKDILDSILKEWEEKK